MSDLVGRLAAPSTCQVPSPHLGLTWRQVQDSDRTQLTRLVVECERFDKSLHPLGPEAVHGLLAELHDGTAEALAGFDMVGTLRAFGSCSLSPAVGEVLVANLAAHITPSWRGRGIGKELFAWQDARVRQLLAAAAQAAPSVTAALVTSLVDEHLTDRRRLYAAAGFAPVRTFRDMRRSLAEPPPVAPMPTGVRIVPWEPARLPDARAAHLVAFADHFGNPALYEQWWREATEALEPAWSFLAVQDDETAAVCGYVLSSARPWSWSARSLEGYTELIGVTPAGRGNGTARALIVASLAAMRQAGMEYAALDVDTANQSGAGAFYARLGYVPEQSQILYALEL
ncbi:GNAT family N-acetyltransferase [Buchananella hordeovulneris]|uniref:GNAT family N-acetyltransferase n=1 Tax=Buchananella hordeovulneris TaxID=52770 RepID=UPI0009FC15D2|nr:GNAT family N-acetyltransferase [Buchananella hordeovulneris]